MNTQISVAVGALLLNGAYSLRQTGVNSNASRVAIIGLCYGVATSTLLTGLTGYSFSKIPSFTPTIVLAMLGMVLNAKASYVKDDGPHGQVYGMGLVNLALLGAWAGFYGIRQVY